MLHVSHIFKLVRASRDFLKITGTRDKSTGTRWIECSNVRNSIGNGFPITKYVGAMVRKSIRVPIAAEIERFEVNDVLRRQTGSASRPEGGRQCVGGCAQRPSLKMQDRRK